MKDATPQAPLWMYYAVHFGYYKVGDIIKCKFSGNEYRVSKADIIESNRGTSLVVEILPNK